MSLLEMISEFRRLTSLLGVTKNPSCAGCLKLTKINVLLPWPGRSALQSNSVLCVRACAGANLPHTVMNRVQYKRCYIRFNSFLKRQMK